MREEIPNYVFQKKYDKFYLATEFDIIFNNVFTEKLKVFQEKLQTKKLLIELDVPVEYHSKILPKIEILEPSSLNDFYEMRLHSDAPYFYMADFLISDESGLWEIYVSLENELGIVACSNDVSGFFEHIFKPYEEESLITKYRIITGMFNNDELKNQFINALEENYSFSIR